MLNCIYGAGGGVGGWKSILFISHLWVHAPEVYTPGISNNSIQNRAQGTVGFGPSIPLQSVIKQNLTRSALCSISVLPQDGRKNTWKFHWLCKFPRCRWKPITSGILCCPRPVAFAEQVPTPGRVSLAEAYTTLRKALNTDKIMSRF